MLDGHLLQMEPAGCPRELAGSCHPPCLASLSPGTLVLLLLKAEVRLSLSLPPGGAGGAVLVHVMQGARAVVHTLVSQQVTGAPGGTATGDQVAAVSQGTRTPDGNKGGAQGLTGLDVSLRPRKPSSRWWQ